MENFQLKWKEREQNDVAWFELEMTILTHSNKIYNMLYVRLVSPYY